MDNLSQKSESSPPPRDALIRRGLRMAHLRLMVALDETGQVSGAAAMVGMTQPAASRLLAELERTVGARVYDRHARGVTLTQAGRTLATRAREVLHRLDDMQDEIGAMIAGVRGPVRIGSVTGPAVELVLPVIRELRVTYPEIELSVLVDTSDKLGEALLSRDLDFYIGRLPAGLDPAAIELEEIGPEPVSLVVRQEHPLSRRARVTMADCLQYDWVMQPDGGLLRRTVEDHLLRNGLPLPGRILNTASMLLTLAIISQTNAVAPLSRPPAEFYASPNAFAGRIRVLPLEDEISVVPYALVMRRDAERSPAIDRVLEMIRRKVPAIAAAAR